MLSRQFFQTLCNARLGECAHLVSHLNFSPLPSRHDHHLLVGTAQKVWWFGNENASRRHVCGWMSWLILVMQPYPTILVVGSSWRHDHVER